MKSVVCQLGVDINVGDLDVAGFKHGDTVHVMDDEKYQSLTCPPSPAARPWFARWFQRAADLHAQRFARHHRPWSWADVVYLTMGLAGEAGEVANEVKKAMRGDYATGGQFPKLIGAVDRFLPKIRKELADTRVYLDLLIYTIDTWSGDAVDFDAVVEAKLDEVAARPESPRTGDNT